MSSTRECNDSETKEIVWARSKVQGSRSSSSPFRGAAPRLDAACPYGLGACGGHGTKHGTRAPSLATSHLCSRIKLSQVCSLHSDINAALKSPRWPELLLAYPEHRSNEWIFNCHSKVSADTGMEKYELSTKYH